MLEFFTKQKDDKNPLLRWYCCQEPSADGGKYYHTVISLEKSQRWMLIQNVGGNLHFLSQNLGYDGAYKYISKDKSTDNVLLSPGHVNLITIGSPRIKKCMQAFPANAKVRRKNLKHSEKTCSSKSKRTHAKVKRLSNVEMPEFILENNITDDSQLMTIAKEHHELGEKDLYRFVVNKISKAISNLVKTTWDIHSAPETIYHEKTARIDTVKVLLLPGKCVSRCEGESLRSAKVVLKQNRFNVYVYVAVLRDAIIKGRHKNNNITLVGPPNCGMSFLVNPLELIFKFCKPRKWYMPGLD